MPTWQEVAFPAFGGFPFQSLQAKPVETPETPIVKNIPEPYVKEEFPKWMQDLWRGGVIFVGSIPFTFFFTFEGYDVYRYVSSGLDPLMVPWPLRPASEIVYDDDEKFWLIVTALSASLLVSVADYILGIVLEPSSEVP
jgi:hypothetical protein